MNLARSSMKFSSLCRGYLMCALALTACGGKTRGGTEEAAGGASNAEGGAPTCSFEGFEPAVVYPTTREPTYIVAIDRTHSGHLDLVVNERSTDGEASVMYVNAGDGTFTRDEAYGAAANSADSMVAADFDQDGHLDLASHVTNGTDSYSKDQRTGKLLIDFGDSDGEFAASPVSIPTSRSDGFLTAGDFDGDGRKDIAFAGYNYFMSAGGVSETGAIALPGPIPTDLLLDVFFNRGDGSFDPPVSYANLDWLQYREIATGDFDGDGHPDIAELSAREPSGFGVFFNRGDGSFDDQVDFVASTTWISYGLGVADFDGDGKDDVATATIINANLPGQANVLEVFTATGNGGFNEPAIYPMDSIPRVYQIMTGDFTGDGHPDLAMVMDNEWGQTTPIPIAVFENLGDGSFGAPINYQVGGQAFQYVIGIAAGDLNGDRVTDLAVTTSGSLSSPNPNGVSVLLSRCE